MKRKVGLLDIQNKMFEQFIAIEFGKLVIINLAKTYAECDDYETAVCILDQISGMNIEQGKLK